MLYKKIKLVNYLVLNILIDNYTDIKYSVFIYLIINIDFINN